MKQREVLEKVTSAIIKDGYVDALFLKGSLARGDGDAYSDIDLYCLVSEEHQDKVLKLGVGYLEHYKELVYHSRVFFVCPQIVGIYVDGMHMDLYVTTIKQLKQTDQIKIIYDPKGLMSQYEPQDLALDPEEFAEVVTSFSYTVYEFSQSYKRGDYYFAFRMISHLHYELTKAMRLLHDPGFSQLGIKKFAKKFQGQDLIRYQEMVSFMKIDTMLICVRLIIDLMKDTLGKLSIQFTGKIDVDFLQFVDMQIRTIEYEEKS